MKAAVISLKGKSSRQIAEEMRKYFDEVEELDIREIEVLLESKKMQVLYNGEPVKGYDCVLVRGSFRYAAILTSLTTILQQDTYMPIRADAITVCHDKFLTQLKLQEHGIPMPSVYMAPTADAVRALLEKLPYPVVMKLPHGTQGKGVMFADSYASASSLIDALSALQQSFIIQDYVETGGKDIRAIVVGEKVVASMMRKSLKQEARANLHAGGVGQPVTLSAKAQQLAVKTARAIGAEICGVDILEGPVGPTVIEVNVSPGLARTGEAVGINISDKVAKYLYERTKEIKKGETAIGAQEVLQEIEMEQKENIKDFMTTLDFRGSRILLPEFVTKISGFDSEEEVIMNADKGKVLIKKSDVQ